MGEASVGVMGFGGKVGYGLLGFGLWQNYDGDASFDGKEHDIDGKKPEYEVILSPSNSAQSRKQDDKTKKEAKGKSPVESFTKNRDLSAEFKDYSDNSSNEVNAVGSIVPTVRQNSSNSTKPFSVAELEDITYSNNENDVGAKAKFNNLETSITEEPKMVHQALKDPSWIEAMQEELLQFKMQKVWILVDLPHGKREIGTKWVYKNKKDERGIVFWNTVAIKQVNDVTRLQALVDKKKVVVTEAVIREVLRLDDAEGVDCLPNEEIFTELARMGYEKPSIKLTFYKAVFSSQWNFLIHTILLSMVLNELLGMNLAQQWHLLSFAYPQGMLVGQKIKEEGDEEEHVEDVTTGNAAQGDDTTAYGEVPTVQHTPPQSPQAQPQNQPQPQQTTNFPMSLLQEALDACAALTRRVEHLEYDKVAQALKITKLKRRRIDTSDDTVMDDESNQGRMIDEMDKDDVVALMDDKKDEEAKVKENQEKDKIGSKPDKNGKRVEAGKSLKQMQLKEEEKPKKTQKEWSKTHTRSKSYSNFKRMEKEKDHFCNYLKVSKTRAKADNSSKL
nr:putative ribonuclease H-like domain-containing protein [Tanacetum cinerariifolium]